MTFQIVKKRKIFFILSSLLVLASIIALLFWQIKLGVDFAGGSLLEIEVKEIVKEEEIKQVFDNLNLGKTEIVDKGGNDYLIRFANVDEDTHQKIVSELKKKFPDLEEKKFENISPSISSALKNKAILAGILSLIGIVVYLTIAFRKVSRPVSSWKYGLIAILTLFHDVIIAFGFYVVWSHFFGGEFNSICLIALLTIMGYSVNDTIVVFDRTRENLRKKLGQAPFEEIVNQSLNETISRSINTSLTTSLPLLALLFFGPNSLFDFSLIILIGILVGTYSSICLASPLLTLAKKEKRK